MKNPSTLIFLGLAVVWAIVLLPEGIKRFSRMRRSDSIRSFNHQLHALNRSGPGTNKIRPDKRNNTPGGMERSGSNVIDLRHRVSAGKSLRDALPLNTARVAAPAIPPHVRRRRQEVIATLSAAVVLTLLCLVAFGPIFIVPQLAADVLLGAYLYMVAQANRTAAMAASASSSLAVHRYGAAGSTGRPAHEASAIRVMPASARSSAATVAR